MGQCVKKRIITLPFFTGMEVRAENNPFHSLLSSSSCLVAVVVILVGTLNRHADVGSLSGSEGRETDLELLEVETSDLLIELLGDENDLLGDLLAPEHELSEALVGEGSAHHEARVASGAAEVDETALSEEDDCVAVGEDEAIDLRLDGVALDSGPGHELGNLDLIVEVTDVAHDAVVTHLGHVLGGDDVAVAGAGDEDLSDIEGILDASDLVASHGSLKGADGIDLSDDHTAALTAERLGAALAHITIAADAGDLAAEHDVGGTLDTVDERVTAAIDVVELALGDGVVDVDGREEKLTLGGELVETVDTSGGLLGNTTDLREDLVEVSRLLLLDALENGVEALELFAALVVIEHLGLVLSPEATVDHESGVTTIINDQLRAKHVTPVDCIPGALPVLLECLALPGKDRGATSSNSSSSVVLSGEDVAGSPANLGTESLKGLDQHSGLDGHVKRASQTNTLERLLRAVLLTNSHQSRHFVFSKVELLTTKISKSNILNFVIVFHLQKARERVKELFKLPDYVIKPLDKEQLNNIHFPIMCKRINACSSKIAHEMALVPSLNKVDEAKKMMVVNTNNENEEYIIQQFINHDGILFKIYVYDNNFKVIIRPSLKNVNNEDVVFFDSQKIPKEFNVEDKLEEGSPPPNSFGNLSPSEVIERKTKLLDENKITEITKDLSECLNLTLYGYDVIIDSVTNDYYIVDVNYFPAFAGVKDFNEVLLNAILKKLKNKN